MRRLAGALVVAAFGAMALAPSAHAVPSFVRQTGMTCAQCHVMFGAPVPNFTFTGKKFRLNGYRVPFVTDKVEAGKVGAVSGRRLAISLFPYLSLRYQSVFAQQAKAPGATAAGPITSNPTSRLAIFTGGPVADYFGLWTEMYLTPDGSATGEWTLGLFSFDEYDLRFTKSSGNNVFGLAFNNQGISEVSGFGPWPIATGDQTNRGGFQGWSHPNRGNLIAYTYLNDQLLVAGGASPGENNLDWKKLNYLGQVAFAPFHGDERELWLNVMFRAGNDAIPILTNNVPNAARGWTYTDAVGGLATTAGARGTATAYNFNDMDHFSRVTGQLRYSFIDRGPHSMEAFGGVSMNKETYTDAAETTQNSVAGALRYVYNRTYGLDLLVQKNTKYQYTGPTGTVFDIANKVNYSMYGTFQPAMNIILALRYGSSQSTTLNAAALTGWSWTVNIDYLF